MRCNKTQNTWIIEDDYLGELQLDGRATPALASGEGADRVIHIGTFSKTMSPALGLGFVVVPKAITEQFVEVAAVMLPAPNRTTQLAIAEFLTDGHFLRHLRQMKDLYCERRALALRHLSKIFPVVLESGLGLVTCLPGTVNDVMLAAKAREQGLAPSALSPWYTDPVNAKRGFILSITNLRPDSLGAACEKLQGVVGHH